MYGRRMSPEGWHLAWRTTQDLNDQEVLDLPSVKWKKENLSALRNAHLYRC